MLRPSAQSRRARALEQCLAGARALQLGNTEAGLRCYMAGVTLAPDDADVAALHGVALRSAARLPDAQRELIRAIALDPSRPDTFTQLAQTYRMAGDRTQAAQAFLAAAVLRPTDAVAWRDAAESLRLADRLQDGLNAAARAAALAPDDPSIANTTALLLHRNGQLDEALALCEQARSVVPDDLHLTLTHGALLRTFERYDGGWALYERRLELPEFAQRPNAPHSLRWNGNSLYGRHILVRAEQGLGDQIQFVRWANLLRAHGAAQVTVQAAPTLVRLLRTLAHVDSVVPSDLPTPRHHVHVDMGSLPYLLRTGSNMCTQFVPYLQLPERGIDAKHALPARTDGVMRIGIVWGGSPLQEDNRFRSIPLALLAPALLRPDVQVVILQQGPARAQLETLAPATRHSFLDAAIDCVDMADTALIASQCDIVLSVCTSVVHLAGALGLPTWVMLASPAEWRWGQRRADSMFYPTLRLFRQQRGGDWHSVLDQLRRAIDQWHTMLPSGARS